MSGETNRDMSIEEIMLSSGTEEAAVMNAEEKPEDDGEQQEQPEDKAQPDGGGTEQPEEQDAKEQPSSDGGGTEKPEKEGAEQPGLLELEHLGKRKAVTLEEAKALAQKGLDYDHVKGELAELKKRAPAIELVEQYAKDNGLSLEEYVTRAEQMRAEREDAQELEALIKAGNRPAAARELLRLRREVSKKQKAAAAEEEARTRRESAEKQAQEQRESAFRRFVAAYPDVTTLPQEVAQAVAAGEEPLVAYQRWENAELKRRLKEAEEQRKADELNERNRKKNPGSIATGQKEDAPDPLDAALKAYGM